MEIPRELLPWLAGILGAFVGSFLNVCIHRMPEHRSIVVPRSACPACGVAIAPWHNVPLLSWMVLKGRCAACSSPISVRYPLVEGATAVLFALAALRFEPGWALAHALVFIGAMIVLFFTDLDARILPDLVTIPGTAAGLVFAVFRGSPRPWVSAEDAKSATVSLATALAAALGAAGSLWLVGRAWLLLRPGIKAAMGLGDVKMMALVGAFLGARLSLMTVFLGSLLGTTIFLFTRILMGVLSRGRTDGTPRLGGIQRMLESAGFLVGGKGAGLLDQIPFGSMLALGGLMSLFYGEKMIAAYLSASGLAS